MIDRSASSERSGSSLGSVRGGSYDQGRTQYGQYREPDEWETSRSSRGLPGSGESGRGGYDSSSGYGGSAGG